MINKRSSSYVTTIGVSDPAYAEKIERVRQTVRALNAAYAGEGRRYRVSLRGRLGRNNPNAIKYRSTAVEFGNRKFFFGGAHPYQMIRLADASRVDVYIHRR